MIIPDIPRYNLASKKALAFLLKYKISALPVSPIEIIKRFGCSIRTYSFHANKLECSVQDICEACGSIDGYSVYDELTGKYKITYNDQISSSDRIRFTLMHELGHIFLHHFIDFEQTKLCRGGLNNEDLEVLDKEANHFASKVLAPEMVLLRAGWKQPETIHEKCALSTEASKYKAAKIIEMATKRDFITNLERQVLYQFYDFIYQKSCKNCNHYFIIPGAKYCPVCGSKQINWGRRSRMIYDKWDLDQNGKAKKCPHCENEEIDSNFNICKICGTNLVNKCAGKTVYYENGYEEFQCCETIADGNARYCVNCGAETTYFQQKLLKPWDMEMQEKRAVPPIPPALIPLTNPFSNALKKSK
ncbi:Zn-dependent peptidase ImmA (M78 family) [Sporomusaceae bacterium BoRhaA]|uniref:ImmA/IrrE family metallo-endopeptidase n=1 Tax=Pelorhabdus rhamnosifermentans TaxID=2772457 RepID=UPI001C062A8E|nr:ImmA/IrrE family metallo-endopeptidase [Pelorhabdus rhamnosifermentans]MBU2701755.1 Zn-dependent peptidase ImmA (M78 family) [Pelorhabdus rhamnosifermentans]